MTGTGLRIGIAALALGIIGAVASQTPASASPVYVSNVQTGYGEFNSVTLTGPWMTGTLYYAGQIDMTANPGTSYDPGTSVILSSWCVDLFHDVNVGGSYQYQTGSLATNNDPGNLLNLSASQESTIGGLAAYGNDQLAAGVADANMIGAAVQVAIWETEYAGLGVTDAGLQTEVNTLLGMGLSGSSEQLVSLDGSQNQVLATVPEPASLTVLAGGLFCLGLVRRRKRRNADGLRSA